MVYPCDDNLSNSIHGVDMPRCLRVSVDGLIKPDVHALLPVPVPGERPQNS